MREIEAHPELALELIVMGAHLTEEFGRTVDLIEEDGFDIVETIDCLDREDSDRGMARTIGSATTALADVLSDRRPDILLLIADRYEMLAPAAVALALRIPIAHIEGGDVSEGAIDDAVRNALTKMAHLHFTPTLEARRRVLAMGEEPWRVIWSGAPSLDHLRRSRRPTREALEGLLGQSLSSPVCVVAIHPVTLERDTTAEANAVFAALEHWHGTVVFCFPNADAGYSDVVARARSFCAQRERAKLHVNLDHLSYWGLLEHAEMLVGNSSSGIMETASLGLPTVDIGTRQHGRTKAANVIHADPAPDDIAAAMVAAAQPEFRDSLRGMVNPYGDGKASERIVAELASAPDAQVLLHKHALALEPDRAAFKSP